MSSAHFQRQPIAAIPPAEVEKICAGEVVERPLSVVKELIENALDAGARVITVELEDGGRRLIRVSDDGHGIPAEELPLALRPHHTSKLRSLDDLQRLSTLGFRGEALSSIAAVSKVVLSSNFGGAGTGHRIEVQGGDLSSSSPCNLRCGSEVEVRDLFFNVPARLKFLRGASSESAQVSGLLTSYALAYPEVKWTLKSGGRTLLASDGDGNQRSVLADLLGVELAADLAPVDFEYPPLAATGWVSAPHRHWHNRTRQWFLINRRPVGNKLLYKAVDDAMREFVTPGKFPAGVFMLDLPPEEIDVNVHPAKTEVAFAQSEAVYSLLLTAVRRALGKAAAQRQRYLTQGMSLAVSPAKRDIPPEFQATPPLLEFPSAAAAPGESALEEPQLEREAAPGQRAVPVYDMERQFVVEEAAEVAPARPELPIVASSSNTDRAGASPMSNEPDLTDIGPIRQISQVADTYLVLTTDTEVYLIDQHSAHERILFEDLWQGIHGNTQLSRQLLLMPQSIQLTPSESSFAEQLLGQLDELGFTVQLNGNVLEISAVPALLAARVTPELLGSCISELAAGGTAAPLHNAVKHFTATLACKAAIRAGQRLPDSEREELVRLICSRKSSLTCPHGRPTVIRLGEGDLERMFLRT
jgi:DNA mismatch repair protein MutL